MKISVHLKTLLDQLKSDHAELVQEVRDLQIAYTQEARQTIKCLYRSFGPRNEATRLRVDWYRHEFKTTPSGRKVRPRRIDTGKSYNQSIKFMGAIDLQHQQLFNRYEPRLAVIRELADRNADSRKIIEKHLAAAERLGQ